MMSHKNLIVSLIFTIAFGLATFTTLILNHTSISPNAKQNLPDAFMEDVVAFILTKEGKPKMKVETPKMVHFASNDIAYFTQPYVTLYRESQAPWFISAKFGKSIQGLEQIDFWENVIIHHPADNAEPDTTIQTAEITIYPNTNIAKTSQAIVLNQPNFIVNAIGMHANMKTGDVKLLSHARGEYVPEA